MGSMCDRYVVGSAVTTIIFHMFCTRQILSIFSEENPFLFAYRKETVLISGVFVTLSVCL